MRNKQESNCDAIKGKWKPWRKSKLSWEDSGVCGTGDSRKGKLIISENERRLESRKEMRVAALAAEVRFYCSLVLTTWNAGRFTRK